MFSSAGGLPARAGWKVAAHLLQQNPRLRTVLRAHAGRTVGLRIEGLGNAEALIRDDGGLDPVSSAAPDATLHVRLSPAAALAALRGGRTALMPHLRVEGDVMVAAAVAQVARDIGWDFEEDLSRVVGDVAARRIGMGLRAVADESGRLGRQAVDIVGRRVRHPDSGLAVSAAECRRHQDELRALAARIQALERHCNMAAPLTGSSRTTPL